MKNIWNTPNIPMVGWTEDVGNKIPKTNGHNTPYYKMEKVFKEETKEWILEQVEALEKTLETRLVTPNMILPQSGKCTKCNCLLRKRGACIFLCACKTIRIQRCVRCSVIQWLLEGVMEKRSHSQIYEKTTNIHPGFIVCHSCQLPITLRNFCKIQINE